MIPKKTTTKTYILAPNFTYKPKGAIRLGSIIADPFRPARSLSQLATPPAVETVVQYNHEATRQTSRSLRLSLWAQVLAAAGAGFNASRAHDNTDSISAERLETRYLAQEPVNNDPELAMQLKEPRVRAAVEAGLYGCAPVYLISGVKIARGLTVRSETSRSVGGGVGLTVPAAQAVGVDVGAEVGGERGRGAMVSFTSGDEEVLVAYQVHVLKAKGNKAKESVMADGGSDGRGRGVGRGRSTSRDNR
ncbi:hypothetical protein CMUS01_12738 [Colletotrichum musicola]|uniref:Uncharacterized protein n=1 Tax=Colletotrichum musicola TaxID=2175873 RepID=A0A8H6JJU3_9PEZI|nr:hypothetical protein CMUS01_12738 [Colletotrichum musicola]